MRNWIEWGIAVTLAAVVWAFAVWAIGQALTPATAALPPAGAETEPAPAPQVMVTCGYQIVAVYAALDLVTKQPLYALSEDLMPVGVLPYPCPQGIGQ